MEVCTCNQKRQTLEYRYRYFYDQKHGPHKACNDNTITQIIFDTSHFWEIYDKIYIYIFAKRSVSYLAKFVKYAYHQLNFHALPQSPSDWSANLKLVRTPLNVYFTAFKSIFLSLYEPITSYECHAWFHLNAVSPSARNTEQVNITKNSCPRYDSNHQNRIPWFPACPSNHSATGTVNDMRLELLQYLFTLRYNESSVPCAKTYTENENKIIANLQFGDWYHLNTRWLTQKEKFIMSYMSMTIYNIYSFLFIIVFIVCFIICFLYYIFVTIKGNKSYKLI